MGAVIVPGYTLLERVQEDNEFTLLRGKRDEDSFPVLVRVPVSEYPSAGALERIEREFSLRAELDPSWAVRPLALLREKGGIALILQDPGGAPLDTLVGRSRTLSDTLRLAQAFAHALSMVHGRNLIHKDFKPANVLFNPDTGEVRLMGFGIASRLPRERQAPDPPQVIAGTLAYMSPEQTGRMNRSLDSRGDLYSLGVTLYELLTGALPFAASDPMEWIHCHVARQPVPPRERIGGGGIPRPVSDLVLKLLAKMAEERYQTAEGVEADLSRCLEQWETQGRIDAFPLGERDASPRLLIPEKLYGREREIQALLDSFGRVAERGASELVMISGYSGIGKSSLVNELHKVIVPTRGLYASGKFDQYKRNIPYGILAQAFRSLVQQVLAKSEEEVAGWRKAILEAVSPNGQVLLDLLPELGLLIGVQPPMPELPPQEAQNRFHAVFLRFLCAFARKEHPLVLFLDDLQWLDVASFKLLEYLIARPEVRHLLLIGAYRDNEVGPSHPLTLALETIRKAGVWMEALVLTPLSLQDVGFLLADALRCGREHCAPLARLVHRKTEGNPFFTLQLLSTLYEERLLVFDAKAAAWRWEIEGIDAKGLSENVVDLMVDKLQRLSKDVLETLKIFACLGNAADSATLARVYGKTEEETGRSLWEAVRAEFILRLGKAYRFQHDRIQEAVYSLIPEPMRAGEHLLIGRLLAGGMTKEALEEEIFFVVGQFNQGIGLISDAGEKSSVLRMNALAGRKAKASIAYASARDYLALAMALLPADAWEADYGETFSLALDLSECEYLAGRHEAADSLFNLILAHARSNPDRAKVFHLRMKLFQVAGRFQEAMQVGLEGLGLFGVRLPESREELEAAIAAEFQAVPRNMGGRRPSELLDAPVASDSAARAIIKLIAELLAPIYISRPEAYPFLVLKCLNISLRHGNTEESCLAYSFYALFLSGLFNDIAAAWEFSGLALRLNEKFKDAKLRGSLLVIHVAAIHFWKKPFKECIPLLEESLEATLKVGDMVYALYSTFSSTWTFFEAGLPLGEVPRASVKYLSTAQQSHNVAAYQLLRLEQQFLACLQGLTRSPTSLDDDAFSEMECLAIMEKANFMSGFAYHSNIRLFMAFLFGRYEEALEHALKAKALMSSALSTSLQAFQPFFHALTLAALHDEASPSRKSEYAGTLDGMLGMLKHWADHCPENFLNRWALAAAEAARIGGRDLEAMGLYEQAIRSARENGFLHLESLACELAGRFYLGRGLEKNAYAHLRDARTGYLRWGALSKVRQLDGRHPGLEGPPSSGPDSTIGALLGQLDIAAVIKASLVVSEEIVLAALIEKLIVIAMEHAGAERGLLLLPADGNGAYAVRAEADMGPAGIQVRLCQKEAAPERLPQSIIRYVLRTRERLILEDASGSELFSGDGYVRRGRLKSVLCLPLAKQTQIVGILYLENNLATAVFTRDRIAMLEVIASQAAVSLENARLYSDLEESRGRLSAIIQQVPAGLVIAEAPSGRLVQANAKFEQILRGRFLASQAIEHYTEYTGFHPDGRRYQPEEWPLARSIRTGEIIDGEELEILRGDGSRAWISLSSAPIRNAAGSIVAAVVIFVDNTERKRVEEELRQSQKMEAIGRLAGGIAHDFNNLLTAINGYSSLILEGMGAHDPRFEFVHEILKSGERATALTRQLLAYSRKQVLDPRIWNLNVIVKEMEPMLRRLIGEDIRLVTALAPDPGLVRLDRGQVEQILMNLAINARDAMPKGGGLTLETGNIVLGGTYLGTHLEASPGPHVMLAVSDTGSGMTPEVKARLFEPFFTTKGVGKGTGLGLSVVYGIVKQSGGSISVYSEVGQGTTFRLYFPEVQGENRPPREAPAAGRQEDYQGNETLLLVEDDAPVRKFARHALEAQGYRVLEATNGREALQVIRNPTLPIDLVVTDVVMPDMGGFALARRIRKHHSSIPVLFLSGYTEQNLAYRRSMKPQELLLQKPFSPFELARKVRESLDQKRAPTYPDP